MPPSIAPPAAASAEPQQVIDTHALPPSGAPCPSCGCPLEATDKFCPACGTPNPAVKQATASSAVVVEAQAVETPSAASVEGRHFRCGQCGAEVLVDQDQRSFVCPFCDSNYVAEFTRKETSRQEPEFIIGFAITPVQAREKFQTWIRQNAWFNPGDLSQVAVEEKLRGVYLPFWSFPMFAESDWSASIGEYWQRTETYTDYEDGKPVTKTRTVTETEWWPLAGRHHHFYSSYLVSGSKGLTQQDSEAILPFNLPALKRYEPYFLAGWLCEEYSIDRSTALRFCQQHYSEQERQRIAAYLPGDTSSKLVVNTRFHNVSSDLCLLPVYILSYRYQDQLYRFLLNGQTGKWAGQKPVSWQRITVAIVVGLLVVAGLFIAVAVLSR